MPVTKQAIKKVRQDRRKTTFNSRLKKAYKEAVHNFRKNPTAKGLGNVFSKLDRAAKTSVIHKNKASRLKSRLAKLVSSGKKHETGIKVTSKKKATSKSGGLTTNKISR